MTVATRTQVLYEGYDDFAQLRGPDVQAAAARAPFALPPSWRVDRASQTKLTTVVRGPDGETQTATEDTVYLTYRHAREELEVQVLDVASPGGRLYADAVLSDRPLFDVAAGRATLAGRSFIIDTGAHLLRATYHDGGPALSSVHDARVDSLRERTAELLREVQPR